MASKAQSKSHSKVSTCSSAAGWSAASHSSALLLQSSCAQACAEHLWTAAQHNLHLLDNLRDKGPQSCSHKPRILGIATRPPAHLV